MIHIFLKDYKESIISNLKNITILDFSVYRTKLLFIPTIKLYRRLVTFGTFIADLFADKLLVSRESAASMDEELRTALASDLITTLPRQFLKFPDENNAIPTYLK